MDSPISPVKDSPIYPVIFMEHFEKEALRKTSKKPEVQFRYIDNTWLRDMETRQNRTP